MEILDDISLNILNILQEKARVPNVEVARQVGMAPSAVLERIRKLEKLGFIDGYEVRLNPERFGRGLIAFVVVKPLAGREASVGERLSGIPSVQEVHFVAGEDGYLVKLRVRNAAELGRFLRQEIAGIEGIRETRTLTVLDTLKETARFPITEDAGGHARSE